MARWWDAIELLRLAASLRFRLRGRYWTWRMHTAVGGPGRRPAPAEMRRAALEFAAWRRRMRGMMDGRG